MHRGAAQHLVHGVARTMHGQSHQLEVVAGHSPYRRTVRLVVPGPEQLFGEHRHRNAASNRAFVRSGEHFRIGGENEHRLTEHRQV